MLRWKEFTGHPSSAFSCRRIRPAASPPCQRRSDTDEADAGEFYAL